MTDVLKQIGDGASQMRLKDMGDGSVATVLATATSTASATGDLKLQIGDGVTKKRYRDMGDGTFAEVIYGA